MARNVETREREVQRAVRLEPELPRTTSRMPARMGTSRAYERSGTCAGANQTMSPRVTAVEHLGPDGFVREESQAEVEAAIGSR